jgi:hypothetical protein
MATLRATLRATMVADSGAGGVATLLTGGIFSSTQIDRDGINLEDVLDANKRIKPFAIIRLRSAVPFGPEVLPAESRFAEVYFYQHRDYTVIEQALNRTKHTLFHRKFFYPVDDLGLVHVLWAGDVLDQVADEVGGAAMSRSRYQINVLRK